MRITLSVLLLFGLVSLAPNRQPPADFSGEWRPIGQPSLPEPPRTDPPPPPRTVSISVTQSGDDLKIVRRTESGGRDATYNFSYKLNGTETVNQMGPLMFRTRASWEGTALVLASDVSIEDRPVGKLLDRYSLENGQLVVESARTGPAGTMKDRTVHERVTRAPQ